MPEAFVLIRVRPHKLGDRSNFMKTIKEEIGRAEGVKEIKGVFGRYDFLARVETSTVQELGSLVTDRFRSIEGIVETETLVVGF